MKSSIIDPIAQRILASSLGFCAILLCGSLLFSFKPKPTEPTQPNFDHEGHVIPLGLKGDDFYWAEKSPAGSYKYYKKDHRYFYNK